VLSAIPFRARWTNPVQQTGIEQIPCRVISLHLQQYLPELKQQLGESETSSQIFHPTEIFSYVRKPS
jgi:hypothetical protein